MQLLPRFNIMLAVCCLASIIPWNVCAHTGFTKNDSSDVSLINSSTRVYPNFPKPGVNFYDVSGILSSPMAFHAVIDNFADHYRNSQIQAILAIDARGFIFGAALGYKLNLPVIMLRKPGKLPGAILHAEYSKEYGTDSLDMQSNALQPGQRVIIIDDSIATGGTFSAAVNLARQAKAHVVEVAAVIEMVQFKSQRNLDVPVYSILKK